MAIILIVAVTGARPGLLDAMRQKPRDRDRRPMHDVEMHEASEDFARWSQAAGRHHVQQEVAS